MVSITASQIYRIRSCLASAVLPHVHTTSEAADRGTIIHKFIEDRCSFGRDAALLKVPDEYRDECEAINFAVVDAFFANANRVSPELAMVYDVKSLKAHQVTSYGLLKATEIGGRCDLIGYHKDGTMSVVDVKTGQRVAPAKDNWQLKTQALLIARTFGVFNLRTAIAYLNEDGTFELDEATVGPQDLDVIASDLAELADQVAATLAEYESGKTLNVSRGTWCAFCPAIARCPAHVAIVRAMTTEVQDLIGAKDLTQETAPELWEKYKAAVLYLDMVKAALDIYAVDNPFQLPNGYVVRREKESRRYVKSEVALKVLQEYVPDAIEKAFKYTTSASAIEKALDKDQAKVVLDLLDARDGFKKVETYKVKECKK